MCTVSVKVNESALRSLRPELNTTAAIRQWVQQQIDLRIQQMVIEQGQKKCTQSHDGVSLQD